MVGADGDFLQPRIPLDEPQKRYRWASTVTEEKSSSSKETWCVSFCHRPPGYHIVGKALYWRKVWGQSNGVGLGDDARSSDSDSSPPPVDRYDAPRDNAKTWPCMFATVNRTTVRVYSTKRGETPSLKMTAKFSNDDEEELYCVAWVYNANGKRRWWVLAAGKGRVVRVIDVKEKRNIMNLTGHGADIYDVKVHPRDPSLIITASKDESIRLWNLRTGATVVQFQGLKAHHGEVVCLDFDLGGTRFASCSIDNSVRIWDITRDKNVVDAIIESHDAADKGVENVYFYRDDSGKRRQSRIHVAQQPVFNTRAVHKHYVDCVMWVGDALISKSLHNALVLWLPGADRESLSSKSMNYTLLQEYPVSGCDVWFIRFGMDTGRKWVAVGGKGGKVHIYNLKEYSPKPIVLSPGGSTKVNIDTYVRQCAFSDDGSLLITVDDNTNVVQYESYVLNNKNQNRRITNKPKVDVPMKSESPRSSDKSADDEVMEDVTNVRRESGSTHQNIDGNDINVTINNINTDTNTGNTNVGHSNNRLETNANAVARSPRRGARSSSSGPEEITAAPQTPTRRNSARSTPPRRTPRRTPSQNSNQQNEIEVIMIDSD